MGRKKIKLDWELLDKLFATGATTSMAAAVMSVSTDTVEKRIKEEHGMQASEYRETKLSKTKVRLIQKAIDLALNKDNVTMLIFCLKNLCGWSDKNVDVKDVAQQIMLNYKLDDDGNLNSKSK